MSKKVLDNGNTLITDEKTSKEIANNLDNDFKENNSNIFKSNCSGTPEEVAQKTINDHESTSKIKRDGLENDNKLDELGQLEKVNIKDMSNRLCETRKDSLPKI